MLHGKVQSATKATVLSGRLHTRLASTVRNPASFNAMLISMKSILESSSTRTTGVLLLTLAPSLHLGFEHFDSFSRNIVFSVHSL